MSHTEALCRSTAAAGLHMCAKCQYPTTYLSMMVYSDYDAPKSVL